MYTYLTLKSEDFKFIKEFVIEIKKCDSNKVIDEFHYPIIR